VLVETTEAFAPLPAVGFPLARSGGQLAAHEPVQELVALESPLKRYSVRPCELTRILPRLSFATPTVAAFPLAVFGVAEDDPLPPQPASAAVATTSAAPPASTVTAGLHLRDAACGFECI